MTVFGHRLKVCLAALIFQRSKGVGSEELTEVGHLEKALEGASRWMCGQFIVVFLPLSKILRNLEDSDVNGWGPLNPSCTRKHLERQELETAGRAESILQVSKFFSFKASAQRSDVFLRER